MSNTFCSVSKGRILQISLECWELLTMEYEEGNLSRDGAAQYEDMLDFIEGTSMKEEVA